MKDPSINGKTGKVILGPDQLNSRTIFLDADDALKQPRKKKIMVLILRIFRKIFDKLSHRKRVDAVIYAPDPKNFNKFIEVGKIR